MTPSIIANYPDLFDLENCPTGSAMHLGLQIDGTGWLALLERLCARLQPFAIKVKAQGHDFRILSVKQKFGSLRVAYRGGTDDIEAEIELAKAEASKTCVSCGGVGELRDARGQVRVLCQCLEVVSRIR